jgi:hypothetical protein
MPHQAVAHRGAWLFVLGAVALALLTGGCATPAASLLSTEDVLQRLLPSSVQIVLERDGRRFRSGSGAVIAATDSPKGVDCWILTSGHTLARGAEGAQVSVWLDRHLGRGRRAAATVVAVRDDAQVDLALLRVAAPRCATARLGEPPGLGRAVWVVAFPWGRNMTLVSGVVSQVNREDAGEEDQAPRLMIDASVSYGASGGGVYEARTGQLVGLVEGYRTARVPVAGENRAGHVDVPVPGETYVTPLSQIRRFLADSGYAHLPGATLQSAAARP